MAQNNFRAALQRLPDVVKYALVLGVVLFISLLCPDEVQLKYEYAQGERWQYNDLFAPIDFPLKKLPEEIDEEVAQLEAEFSPFYLLDPIVAEQQKNAFEAAFQQQLEIVKDDAQFRDVVRNPERYLNYGTGLLGRIYQKGVIELEANHADKPKDFVLEIVEGNRKRKLTLQNVVDVDAAKNLITDSLPYSRLYVAEFLLPILPDYVKPNLLFSDSITNIFKQEQLNAIASAKGMIRKDDLIVSKGDRVSKEIYRKLYSFESEYLEKAKSQNSYLFVFGGYFLMTSLILGVFMLYVQFYAQDIFKKFNRLLFILVWIMVFSYLIFAVEQTNVISPYIIPFCIVPIVLKIFYSDQLAFFTHIVVILIASFITSLSYEFTIIQILAGIVAVLSNPDARDWSDFFKSLLYIFLTYSLSFIGLSLLQEGTFDLANATYFIMVFLNVILTMLAYPLVPLLERIFGFTSSISLVELSDMNRPLLRELALKAPGTLQHSLQVANLSEAAADKIGADQLLVKVAALYHDIGKTLKPEYFIENQSGSNPHSEISHLDSAKIIIGHVTEGSKLAQKYRLPKILVDFINSHHGTTRVEYFYRNYMKENPEKEFDESIFRYPGPKPSSKEETILMLADSLEAASKSLKNPTGKDIDELVDRIVSGKIEHGQLDESSITFQELQQCIQVFKTRLRSINHVRVEYPEEVEKKQ